MPLSSSSNHGFFHSILPGKPGSIIETPRKSEQSWPDESSHGSSRESSGGSSYGDKGFQSFHRNTGFRYGLFLLCIFPVIVACTPTRQTIKTKPIARTFTQTSPPPVRVATITPPGSDRTTPLQRQTPLTETSPQAPFQPPFAHAVLLNGGMNANANYYSHVVHLKLMRQALQERGIQDEHISIFSADGDNNHPDLVVQNKIKALDEILFDHGREIFLVRPQPHMINTTLGNKRLYPATRTQLFSFFQTLDARLSQKTSANTGTNPTNSTNSTGPVLVFVTDHGLPNRASYRNNIISLWHENLYVRDYHGMLRPLRNRRVISVMSQCFSGGFAWANYARAGELSPPSGNRCGFYSTTAYRPAYGCYPDLGQQTYVGHAHRFASAMRHTSSMDEAHRFVNLTDMTPDIPLRSSDSYLHALMTEEAQKQGISLDTFVDQVLARYRNSGYPGDGLDNQMLQALAQRFQLTEPRSLQEIKQQKKKLQTLRQGWQTIEKAWIAAYQTLRNDHLVQWYRTNPSVYLLLGEKFKLYYHNHSLRKDMHNDYTIQQLRAGFQKHVENQPGLLPRISRLHRNSRDMHQQAFWGETLLAVMDRMKYQLIRIAARSYLHQASDDGLQAHRQGLERLLSCEATPLGNKKSQGSEALAQLSALPVPAAPPYPSWLGVTYQPVRSGKDPRIPAGSVQVRGIYRNTPAAEGGLEPGDYIVGINGIPLQKNYDLREKVMLHPSQQPFVMQLLRNNQKIERTLKLQRFYGVQNLELVSVVGKQLAQWDPLQSLVPGEKLPSLTQDTTLLFFWATWCGPCKLALPTLRRLQQKYRGLKIVTVSQESPRLLRRWIQPRRHIMPFYNAQDPEGAFGIRLHISATPTFLLLHRGRVTLSHRGFHQMDVVEQAIQLHTAAVSSLGS